MLSYNSPKKYFINKVYHKKFYRSIDYTKVFLVKCKVFKMSDDWQKNTDFKPKNAKKSEKNDFFKKVRKKFKKLLTNSL